MKKLSTQTTIIIASLIIGASLITVQVNKQNSIEEQKRMEIAQENRVRLEDAIEKERIEEEKEWDKKMLEACLSDAYSNYWAYMKLNGTEQDDGSITAPTADWEAGKKNKKADEDLCFKKYQ